MPNNKVQIMKKMSVNLTDIRGQDMRQILAGVLEINEIAILLGQETKFGPHFSDGEIELEGFTVASRTDRKAKTARNAGGGTIIYVRNEIKFHGTKTQNIGKKYKFSKFV